MFSSSPFLACISTRINPSYVFSCNGLKSLLFSCIIRRYSNGLEDRWRKDPYPCFPGGKAPGGKEEREARKGSPSQTGKPNLIPVTHLGNEGQLVDGESKTGKKCKSEQPSLGLFSPQLSLIIQSYICCFAVY